MTTAPGSISMRAEAVKLASRGFRVFPLQSGSKKPLRKGWQAAATADAFTVLETWPADTCNVGIATGEDFTVIDADVKDGKPGLENVAAMGLPPTFTIRTASGGELRVFRTPAGMSFGNSVQKLAPGVDVRGTGGLIVGPGSRVPLGEYVVVHDLPVADLPAHIVDRLRAGPVKAPEAGKVVGELDTPAALEAAKAYLLSRAPVALEGSGGDQQTYEVAARVLDFGVAPETCLDLLDEHWNARCEPPWDYDDLARKVANAAQYRQDPIGRETPGRHFEPIVHPPGGAPGELALRPKLFAPSADQWKGKTPAPIPFVVERLIPRGFVTLLVSAGGRGKSTLAQQLMVCVAAGVPFVGFHVEERGAAAGVFCEDAEGTLHTRHIRLCSGLNVERDTVAAQLSPTSYVSQSHVLWQAGRGFTEFLGELDAQIATKGDVRLLVLDGTAHLFSASEIDRNEVTRFIAGLTGLASKRQLGIVLITHESKSSADSDTHAASGSTAWINAARSVLKLNHVESTDDVRELLHIKSNLSQRVGGPIRCAFQDGVFVALPSGGARAEECLAAAAGALRAALENGTTLSPSPHATNFAAKWLEQHQAPETDFTKAEFVVALARLKGTLFETEKYRKGGKTAMRLALCNIADGSRLVPVTDGSR